MSNLAAFIAQNSRLSQPLTKTVVDGLYADALPISSFRTAYPLTPPIRIGSNFNAFPVIPKPESATKVAERVRRDLQDETASIHDAILDAIQALVENNAELRWNQNSQHAAYVQKHNIERKLQSVLDEKFEMCYNHGRFEGSDDGRKVIRRIYGPPPFPPNGMKRYHFSMDRVGSDSGTFGKCLPVDIRSPEEREVLHSVEIEKFRDVLAEIDQEVEALLSLRTWYFLSDHGSGDDEEDDKDNEIIQLHRKIRAKVSKAVHAVFLLGKFREFQAGQQDEKSCWPFVQEDDDWVYSFVHGESDERIFIRELAKRPFLLDSSDDEEVPVRPLAKRRSFLDDSSDDEDDDDSVTVDGDGSIAVGNDEDSSDDEEDDSDEDSSDDEEDDSDGDDTVFGNGDGPDNKRQKRG